MAVHPSFTPESTLGTLPFVDQIAPIIPSCIAPKKRQFISPNCGKNTEIYKGMEVRFFQTGKIIFIYSIYKVR